MYEYDYQEQALKHIKIIKDHTLLPLPHLITLHQQVRFLEENKISGDFVECGVWKGGAAGMIALTQLECGQERRNLRLFDSFEGLPQASREHDCDKSKRMFGIQDEQQPITSSYAFAADLQISKDLIIKKIGYPKNSIFFYKGWFQDTIPQEKNNLKQIALLRLDGDLYESTRVCLESLWDLVVPNGVVIVDDYMSFKGCKKAVDEFLSKLEFKPFLHHISRGGGRYIIKP